MASDPPDSGPLSDEEIENFHHQINSKLLGRFLATFDALRERERKLLEYVAHKPKCASLCYSGLRLRQPCNCGLLELLAAEETR